MKSATRPLPCGVSESAFGGKVKGKAKGFSYHVDRIQIETYRAWPTARRLQWVLEGNKLRRSLPAKTIAIKEAFRQGKI
jgi:hypothetical protein